jgi:hypothetical protein
MRVFFPGCRYLFRDSDAPEAGRMTNGVAEGVHLVLDPKEPPDDGQGPYHVLRHHPLALIARPLEGPAAAGAPTTPAVGVVPEGCVAFEPTSATFTARTQFERTPLVINGKERSNIKITRRGFKTALAYAFTDHFCQGASFQAGKPWLAHMTPPPRGKMSREGILVTCTRFQCWRTCSSWPPSTEPATMPTVCASSSASRRR